MSTDTEIKDFESISTLLAPVAALLYESNNEATNNIPLTAPLSVKNSKQSQSFEVGQKNTALFCAGNPSMRISRGTPSTVT